VLRGVYKIGSRDIAAAIEALLDTANVVVNRQAVEAGLAMLEAGGDFAGGLIDYEGRWLGGDEFVSFDEKAVALVAAGGQKARLPS
jgi:predicted nucleic-acid-binding protein